MSTSLQSAMWVDMRWRNEETINREADLLAKRWRQFSWIEASDHPETNKIMKWCVHDINNMYMHQLLIHSTSESDPCSYEATKAVVKKPRKNIWGFNRILTHDLHDTGAMLYQLSYEALLKAGQEPVQFIPVIWREWQDVYMISIIYMYWILDKEY